MFFVCKVPYASITLLTPDGHPIMLRNIKIIKEIDQSIIYKEIINKLRTKTSKFHILLPIGNQLQDSVTQALGLTIRRMAVETPDYQLDQAFTTVDPMET